MNKTMDKPLLTMILADEHLAGYIDRAGDDTALKGHRRYVLALTEFDQKAYQRLLGLIYYACQEASIEIELQLVYSTLTNTSVAHKRKLGVDRNSTTLDILKSVADPEKGKDALHRRLDLPERHKAHFNLALIQRTDSEFMELDVSNWTGHHIFRLK